ncbi:hypothetical protein N7522_013023 [Penicillium canescens]|nr:hypothetical protein N7522_013023 [Penicillium canescens]
MHSEADIIEILATFITSGTFWTKSNPAYKCVRSGYNSAIADEPLAIARPATEDEVLQLVKQCSLRGIPLTVRSGGHDFFGRSCIQDGIVIDMRGFNFITVSPDRTSVRVGGGVLAGTLQDVLHSHCLFTPTGQSKSVGYISWACGGGYGFYVGKYGFGVDQILGARVIVASGTIVDTDDDPELLWALRGAGAGSFGVVVELRVKVYPEPQILAGYLAYPLSEATAVLNSLELASEGEQPDAFSGDMIVVHPGMLEIPLFQPALVFLWCWTAEDGDMTAANLFLEKTTKFGTILVNTVKKTDPASFGLGGGPAACFFRSRNVRCLDAQLGAIFTKHPPSQTLSAIVIHNNHGKGTRNGNEDGVGASFSNRQSHVILGLHGGTLSTFSNEAQAEAKARVLRLHDEIDRQQIALKGGFPSFYHPDQVDLNTFFGQATAKRLKSFKQRIDPKYFFRQGSLSSLDFV